MVLIESEVKRCEGKNDEGYYCFSSVIGPKEFVYLQTHKDKPEIENWKNNFSEAYVLDREGKRKIVLFSIEGVSVFNMEWGGRDDIPLNRNGKEYRELERLIGDGDLDKVENVFLKLGL